MAKHRNDPACDSCHRKIDPLGFSLEAFDATGKLRTGSVDNQAKLSDGTIFKGHQGLKTLLKEKKLKQFIRHFSSKLLAYALGRELEFTDEVAIQKILSRLKKDEYSSHALIEEIIMSYPFQYRKEALRKSKK